MTAAQALLCLALASAACCDPLDDAARALSKKVAARLAPGESVRTIARNLSSLSAADSARARSVFERGLRRNGANSVEVRLTLSQSLQDFVLVAEFDHNGDHGVEMVRFEPEPAPPIKRLTLERRLLWEQPSPILDVAVDGETLLLLEPQAVAAVKGGERIASQPLEATAVRDPRGRLEAAGGSLIAYLPGATCRGAIPEVRCQPGSEAFDLAGEPVKWTSARNTLEAPGWPPLFSLARVDSQYLAAEAGGRTRLYDAGKSPIGVVDGLGSDIVAVCGRLVLAAGPEESLSVFRIEGGKAVRAGEPVEFGGPITALWPSPKGATAVAKNRETGQYAAYAITLDCGR